MTLSVNGAESLAGRSARLAIERFANRFGRAHLDLACHAAFPLVLSADLLHALWANFQTDRQGRSLDIPWVAVADLLLSGLCHEVGHDPTEEHLFELPLPIRQRLLRTLREDPRFGHERLRDLASFVIEYTEQRYLAGAPDALVQGQRWTALAYVSPQYVATELARRLSSLVRPGGQGSVNAQADLRYLDGIVEILREPLGAEHADLARYTHGVRLYADGDMTGAAALLDPFLKDGHAKLGGLELAVPPVPTPLPKPIEDGPGPKRSELRARINEILPTVVDLRAFCLDYFPTISMQSHASASRQEIVNVILERIEPRELAEALDRSQSAAIRREPAKTSRAEIRRRLAQEFKTEADFDVFCLDFFPAIRKRFANSMDRIAKYNILLELAEPQAIVRSLDIYKEEILRERSSVSELRKRIDKAFPTTESFEVVCLDYFPEIVSQFTVGMTRTARVTLLLSKVSTDEIEKVLEKLESEIGQRREWNSRDNLRKRLWHELPTQPDFDAFCIDYFPETFKLFTSGMERLQKESLLLTREVPERIVEALNQHQSIPPAEPVQYNAPYVSDSASARRVTRRSPLRIIMAIDDSGSMRGMPAEQTLMAIRKFLQELQLRVAGKTELIFVSAIIFGTNAKITVAHADIGTIDPDADIVEIRGLHGGTNIAKALQSARRIIAETKFSASDLPPWIILYTDGNADDPAEALEEARILRSLPLPCESPRIAAVFINNNVDTRFYEQLATAPEYCLGLADVSSIMMLLPEFGP